jgi:hypothetical protein
LFNKGSSGIRVGEGTMGASRQHDSGKLARIEAPLLDGVVPAAAVLKEAVRT